MEVIENNVTNKQKLFFKLLNILLCFGIVSAVLIHPNDDRLSHESVLQALC